LGSEYRSAIPILDHNGTLVRIPVSNSPIPQAAPYLNTGNVPIDNAIDIVTERIGMNAPHDVSAISVWSDCLTIGMVGNLLSNEVDLSTVVDQYRSVTGHHIVRVRRWSE
jgi:hypothetical protein